MVIESIYAATDADAGIANILLVVEGRAYYGIQPCGIEDAVGDNSKKVVELTAKSGQG